MERNGNNLVKKKKKKRMKVHFSATATDSKMLTDKCVVLSINKYILNE